MYLRGSKWNFSKRTRRRTSPFRVMVLLLLIAGGLYLNRFVVPNTPQLFMPTPTPTKSPESFLNEAKTLYGEGKLLPAIDAYEKAVLSEPSNKAIYLELARVQVWAGEYEDAFENAERALVNNENYALAHAVRGWVLGFLDSPLEGKTALKKAITLDPNSALIHAYYSEVLIDSDEYGDDEKAIEESRIAYNLDPSLFEVIRARAYVLHKTGNYVESIDLYRTAININKNIPDLYLYLAYNYKALGEYDQAIEYFVQANSLNPADDIPDLEISRIYATIGDFGKAVQYAELAVEDNDTYPHRYGNLGIMLYRSGDMEAAINNLAMAIHGGTTPDGQVVEGVPLDYGWPAQYYWFYGFSLAKVMPNRCAEAVPVFQALLVGVPQDPDAVYNAEFGLDMCRELVGSSLEVEDTQTP